MRVILGFLFFSVILTIGASLECDVCREKAKTCSKKSTCAPGQDTCMSVLTENKTERTFFIDKSCSTKQACKDKQNEVKTQVPEGPIMTVDCNKAPSSAGSFLLALSGLLLMKILV